MKKPAVVLVLIVLIVLGAVVALGAWLNSMSPEKVEPDANIKGEAIFVRPQSHMTGKIDAKVTLVEFGDFQCGFCAEANPTVRNIIAKYKDNPNFNFSYRHFPLPQHANAIISAQASEAAGAQGKFLEMTEMLYQRQGSWMNSVNPTNTFVGYAQELGLDTNRFREALEASKYINEITQDKKDGEALGINSTPSFFINGQRVGHYSSLDNMVAALLAN